MANPATILARTGQDERIPGLPVLPANTDPATLSMPVYNPATDKTHQAPIGGPAAITNAIVGGMKVVQYFDSRLYGVPATALTLDRLTPATIVPGTLAIVANPASTPLTATDPPQQYLATPVAAGTAGSILVPRYAGAAASDVVPIVWQTIIAAVGAGLRTFAYFYNPAPNNTYTFTKAAFNSFNRLDLSANSTVVLPPITAADLPVSIEFLQVDASGGPYTTTVQGELNLSIPNNLTTFSNLERVGFVGLNFNGQVGWVKVSHTKEGSGLPAGTVFRDPLAIGDNLQVTAAVKDAGNTWVNGDLTAFAGASQLSAGAPPADPLGQDPSILVGTADVKTGDQFDGVWPVDGNVYLFVYSRRTDGTSGWTMFRKGRTDVLTSPNGTLWELSIDNAGSLITNPL